MAGGMMFLVTLLILALAAVVRSQTTFDITQYTPSDYVACDTTQGTIIISLYRSWAPNGVDHFVNLVNKGFYTDVAFYRTVSGFITQFGITDNEDLISEEELPIEDDVSVDIPFNAYYLSFAGGGNNTRTTQLFFSLAALPFLGSEPWETPIGTAAASKSVLKALYSGYGDWAPYGNGPSQQLTYEQGNTYLRENFPLLDYINSCEVISSPPTKAPVASPTKRPTVEPSAHPTEYPTISFRPTESPTEFPTFAPTISQRPTEQPTFGPTEQATEATTEAATTSS